MTTRARTRHACDPTHAIVQQLARAALRQRALLFDTPPTQLGTITLLPHQEAATHWLLARLDDLGGALLADPPGLGKTFTALAVAARRNTAPLVIAPATLRQHWLDAAHATGVHIHFVSTERLSAPTEARLPHASLVIIDEAHHLRTPSTRRHQRTAALCQRADVLLLSATPIHNSHADLASIIQLFHLPPQQASARRLARQLTLRRSLAEVRAATGAGATHVHVPIVRTRRDLRPPIRVRAIVRDIMALLPLIAAHQQDAGDGHPLVQLGILHALRSSDAAARQRIHHRIAITIAVEHAATAGIRPDALLRRAFQPLGSDVQLAMPALLGSTSGHADAALAGAARQQRHALEALLPLLDDSGDRWRARVLRRIARWTSGPVVAFTWSRATAAALCHHLRDEAGVALLTGSGARIASGSITREEVLRRFLPDPHTGALPPAHQRVRLLVTTDVLSEGLSLRGVTTVIHLDLPWTAARLDQRTGRAARIGAMVPMVTVTHLAAPLPAATYDAIMALLARKRLAMQVLPTVQAADGALGDVEATQLIALLVRLATGADEAAGPAPPRSKESWSTLRHGAVTMPFVVALVERDGRRRLVALGSDGRVRRPVLADWQLLDAGRSASQNSAMREQLMATLARLQADRETSHRVTRAGDGRLTARQRSDEALLRHTWSGRTQAAAGVSAGRRAVMTITRPADVAALRAAPGQADADEFPATGALSPAIDVRRAASGDAAGVGRRRHQLDTGRSDVRLVCGIAVVPECGARGDSG